VRLASGTTRQRSKPPFKGTAMELGAIFIYDVAFRFVPRNAHAPPHLAQRPAL
jgi:hypothetical protein